MPVFLNIDLINSINKLVKWLIYQRNLCGLRIFPREKAEFQRERLAHPLSLDKHSLRRGSNAQFREMPSLALVKQAPRDC